MRVPRLSQVAFWACVIAVGFLLLLLLRSVLLPFVAGLILAYFLDPIADWLEARGFKRIWAAVTILVAFVGLLVVIVSLVIPVLSNQVAGFSQRLPDIVSSLQGTITSVLPDWLEQFAGLDRETLRQSVDTAIAEGSSLFSSVFSSILSSGAALLDVVVIFVITPVVAFYMLVDWDRMVAEIDRIVPRQHVETVRSIARDIDAAVAGFIRGQSLVCLILGTFYAVALSMIGLNFALLIGFTAGLIGFIPYVGATVGVVIAVGVAAFQFWPDWQWIIVTAAIFFGGQFVEGNILQPNLVGNKVGLHPVWLMFALVAFGALFGFVGVLIAVPAAAAVGVIVRYAVDGYMQSPLYHGSAAPPDGVGGAGGESPAAER